MSAKHTPGPWFVFDHRSLNGAYWIGREQFETHAEVRGGCAEADEAGDMLANALIIAAAPDLLADLQAAVELFEMDSEALVVGSDVWLWLQSARAAIAKAAGA